MRKKSGLFIKISEQKHSSNEKHNDTFKKVDYIPLYMAFSKSFPKNNDNSPYPEWVDVYLSEKEERYIEEEVRQKNIVLMKQCMKDASMLLSSLEEDAASKERIAIALFERLAKHSVHAKERRCKDKFDEMQRDTN